VIATEWGLLSIVVLLIFDLLIAATRVSLFNARPLRLAARREQHPAAVERALALIENPRLRAVLRLSQTLVRFGLAVLAFYLLQTWAGAFQSGWLLQLLGLLALTLLMLMTEFAVESKALSSAEDWALRLGFFGRILLVIFTPLVVLPLLLLRPEHEPHNLVRMTEDELKTWVETDEEEGGLEREERQMIYSIFQFGETLAREIMVPRIDVLALEENTSFSEAVQAFLESGYSRLPVYGSTIDNVLGLLYAKDLLRTLGEQGEKFVLQNLLRPAYFVPETKKADELLAEMQARRIHMAIVVDEYGGVSGVVTLEDIIEEIIGEIQDEYDGSEELLYQAAGPDEYIFHGRIDLDDFSDVVGTSLPDVDADTLAGFLYEQLGRVPQGGETVRTSGLLLTIEQVIGRRIRRVRVRRIPPDFEENESHDETDERNESGAYRSGE